MVIGNIKSNINNYFVEFVLDNELLWDYYFELIDLEVCWLSGWCVVNLKFDGNIWMLRREFELF